MSTTQTITRLYPIFPRHRRAIERIALRSLTGWEFDQFAERWPTPLAGPLICIAAFWQPRPGLIVPDGPICGFMVLRIFSEAVVIYTVAVDPEYRRRGVASRLLAHAKSKLRGRIRGVAAYVSERNLAMQLTLRAEGFRWTETPPDPSGELTDDVYVFEFRRGIEDVLFARRDDP